MNPIRKDIFAVSLLLLYSVLARSQSHYTGPVIDLHVHVAVLPGERNNLGAPDSITDLLPMLRPNKIARAGIITIAHAGQLAETRRRNDSVLRLCRLYPQLIPICSVHPADSTAAWSEMERLKEQGVSILKLHPSAQHFDVGSPEVAALAERAGALHMALLFDSYKPEDAAELGKLMMLAVNHPDTKFIIAHAGFIHFAELITINVWKKYPWYRNNIFMDISAIAPMMGNSPYRRQLMWVMRSVGISQFLYGTDFPIFTFKESIAAVHRMGFTRAEEKKIFHDNAGRLIASLTGAAK